MTPLNLLRPLAPLLLTASLLADPVPVRQPQGAQHGFVTIHSAEGKTIGSGEYTQTEHAGQLTARFTLHFRDGSLDDDTFTYTQHQTFTLLSDHHIQRGPFFPHPIDYLLEANGNVTTRTPEGKTESTHFDLPNDLSNGLLAILLLDLSPATPELKVSMLAPTGKGRLIKLVINPDSHQTFTAAPGIRRQASVFRIHPELGGIVGVVAPIIGKQPGDIYVTVLEGEAPLLVRIAGPLAEGGPSVSIELAGTAFPAR